MLALLLVAVSVGVDNFAAAIAIGVSGVDARTRLRVGLVFGAFEAGMPLLGLVIGAQAAGPLGHAARWVGGALLVAVGGYAIIAAGREQAKSHQSRAATEGGGDDIGGDKVGGNDSRGDDGREDVGGDEVGRDEVGRDEVGRDGDDAQLAGAADSPGADSSGAAASAASAGPAGSTGSAGPVSADRLGVTAVSASGQEPPIASRRPPPTGFARLLLSALALSLDNLVVGFALGASHTSVWLGAIVIGVVSAALSLAGLELGARAGRWAGERSEQLAGLLLIFVGVALWTGLLG